MGGENTEKERYLRDFFSYKERRYAEFRNMPYHLKVVESLKMGFFLKALKKGIGWEKEKIKGRYKNTGRNKNK